MLKLVLYLTFVLLCKTQYCENGIRSYYKISDTEGGFDGILDDDDRFGISVSWTSDLDGDSVPDLAVGAYRDDDGGIEYEQ